MIQERKLRGALVIVTVVIVALGLLALLGSRVANAQGTGQMPCDPSHMSNGQTGHMGSGMMGMMGGSMMGNTASDSTKQCAPMMGMMSMMSGGMMGNGQQGMMGDGHQGMMGGMMSAHTGAMGSFGPGKGMMGAWTPPAELIPANTPLTLDKATSIAKAYIAAWDSKTSLKLGEVMQFSNHFYGEALETESGRGAFEFLIDTTNGTVYAEPGPNMMWNLRYGTMSSMMGMGSPTEDGTKMTISAEQAVQNAQGYLDKALPGAKVEDKPLAFYGFYTLDVLRDGKIAGMVSVNGYTGQVWLHHWHGDFVNQNTQQ